MPLILFNQIYLVYFFWEVDLSHHSLALSRKKEHEHRA